MNIEQICGMLIMSTIPLTAVGLLYMVTLEKPLFKKNCEKCCAKDTNWTTVPIGHDDFAWQHNCKANTNDI